MARYHYCVVLRRQIATGLTLVQWYLAYVWRSLLVRTTFVAVTGSLGKTTPKDCLAAMLERLGPTRKSQGSWNTGKGISMAILRARPWHRFVVLEAGTGEPGEMTRSARLVRPDVALILTVARTHTKEFKTLDHIAAEKAELLRFLRPGGTAVLNGDDPRLAEIARTVRGQVVLFGSSPRFDVWGRDPASVWPDRFQFTACAGDDTVTVRTQFAGTHWLTSVLGAVAAAKACGVGLSQAAEAVSSVAPYIGRMYPAMLPNGAVVLDDSYNGSIDSFERAIEVLRQARAQRRILVISDCSDFRKKPRERLQYYARVASHATEMVVFVGDRSTYGIEYAQRSGMPAANARAFFTWQAAADFLRKELRPGDLVLVRGRGTDHLERVRHALAGTVACQKSYCSLMQPCQGCPQPGFQPDSRLVTLDTRG
jgi:UDP-N-acetylmuramoyl-tripeptide--D-alanyl-D-alanine ligase